MSQPREYVVTMKIEVEVVAHDANEAFQNAVADMSRAVPVEMSVREVGPDRWAANTPPG